MKQAPAQHVRHAVSIHERRLKFKPALFVFEKDDKSSDVKEVWFAGNHCDVGGGFYFEGPGKHLLSDIPLAWMVEQVTSLEDEPAGKLALDKEVMKQRGHLKAGSANTPKQTQTKVTKQGKSQGHSHAPRDGCLNERRPHDFLAFDRGVSRLATLGWWILGNYPRTSIQLLHT